MRDIDVVSWAERFVATPSVSRDGNAAIAGLALELVREIGLEPRLDTTTQHGVPQANLIADAGPAGGEDGLLLLTHLDTVPPGPAAAWTKTAGDPFRAVREGDRLYGLGSADAKVDFVCKAIGLAQVLRAQRGALRRRVRLVGTFGEEIGLLGARHLVASGHTRGLRFALVGEPSELACVHAHKGYAVFEARLPRASAQSGLRGRRVPLELQGSAAHSSTPDLGKNAIEAALDRIAEPGVIGVLGLEGGGAVNQVPDACSVELVMLDDSGGRVPDALYPAAPLVAFQLAWRALRAELARTHDARFDPDHTVANLGRVELQDGRPLLAFDVRPVPGVDAAQAVSQLGWVAEIECRRTNPPLWTAPEGWLARAVGDAQQQIGLPRRLATKATCTEAGVLAAAGLEALVIGPGPSVGNVHRPNEHTRISQLVSACDLYAEVIRRLCVGDCVGEDVACSS